MKVDRTALARFANLRLRAPGIATSLQQGDRRSPFLGRGLEFADYREYDPADDIRLIDWNVYLRLGQVLVRQFTEQRSLSIKICVDASASMGFGSPNKADQAATMAATLATIALTHRDPVTLVCFGNDRPPAEAKAVNVDGMAQLLHVLGRTDPGGHGDPYAHLAAALGAMRSDRLFLFSDLLYAREQTERVLRLAATSSRHPVLVHMLSAEEMAPDLRDTAKIVDAETGQELTLKTNTSAAETYQRGLEEWLDHIQQRCRLLGVQYLRPSAHEDPAAWVNRRLHHAKVVEHTAGGNQ